MKVCVYCESTVPDDTYTCPHCTSSSFKQLCPRCGGAYEGAICPACKAADDSAYAEAARLQEQAAAEVEANQGLAWKTILTVFLPFVGGFFLIRENVKQGFRVFAIIWCLLMAMATGGLTEYSAATRFLTSVLCLAPVAYYLFKSKNRLLGKNTSGGRAPLIVISVVLGFVLLGDIAIAATNPEPIANSSSGVKAAMFGGAPSSSAASSSSASSSSSSASVSAADVKLTPTTEYLEYSNKDVDPLTLVTCNPSARLATNDAIDLTKVGTQEVAYKVSTRNDSATLRLSFKVRDTKAPVINLANANPAIDQYAEFDPIGSIASIADVVDGDLARVDAEPEARGTNPGNEVFYDAGWYVIDGAVDSATPGTYSLMVKAADKHGNVATKELLVTVNEVASAAEEPAPAPAMHSYIVNANTGKFHNPGCRDVKKMKDSNKLEMTATRDDMIAWGYSPCGHCNP